MFFQTRYRFPSIYKIAGEGEGETGNKETPPPAPENKETPKTFTQEQVNAMMARDKDKAKKDNERLLAQLQTFAEQGLTTDNLTSLQSQIEELKNEGKSKETLAKEKEDKLLRSHRTELDKLSADSKKWKSQYEQYRLESEIGSAAATKKARNPQQIQALLGPKSYFREELGEDKKPTGAYTPRIKMTERDKDGQEVLLDLTVTEAVDRLSQTEEHMNLFDSGASGGLGSYSNGSTHKKTGDLSNLPMDQYYQERKKRLTGKS